MAVVIRVSDNFFMCPRLVVSGPGPSLFVLPDRGGGTAGWTDVREARRATHARPPAAARCSSGRLGGGAHSSERGLEPLRACGHEPLNPPVNVRFGESAEKCREDRGTGLRSPSLARNPRALAQSSADIAVTRGPRTQASFAPEPRSCSIRSRALLSAAV